MASKRKRWIFLPLLFAGFALGAFLITPPPFSQVLASAQNGISVVQEDASTRRDALIMALTVAKHEGLDHEPDAIYIAKGIFKKFEEPGESWRLWDQRTVYAVQIRARFIQAVGTVKNVVRPVNYIVIFIDERTGQLAGWRSGLELSAHLSQMPWIAVTKADAGKFPVGNERMPPEFYPKYPVPAESPPKTATPVSQ